MLRCHARHTHIGTPADQIGEQRIVMHDIEIFTKDCLLGDFERLGLVIGEFGGASILLPRQYRIVGTANRAQVLVLRSAASKQGHLVTDAAQPVA